MTYELFPKTVEKMLPKLYAQDDLGGEAIAFVKFFDPYSSWTWFVLEYDPEKELFFGWVVGFEKELGYFSLEEIRASNRIERDIHFTPTKLKDLYGAY